MNKIKKFIKKQKFAIGLVIGALVLTGLPVFAGGGSIIDRIIDRAALVVAGNINTKINESGVLDNLTENLTENLSEEDLSFGAVPGSSFPGPCISVGGLEECSYSGLFKKATTTLFSIKSPNATTSLIFVSMQNTVGTGTAATWVVATSTSAFATTTGTSINSSFAVAASATESFTWTPLGGSVDDNIIPPNTYILGKTEGVGLGGYTYGAASSWKVKLIKL